MLKKILSSFVLISFLSLPAFAAGQQLPTGKWWYNPRITDTIELTDKQKTRLDAACIENRRALIDLKSAVEKEQLELENLMESKAFDKEVAMEQAKKLEKARTNLAIERFSFVLQVRIIIGNDKFRKLKTAFGKLRRQKRHAKAKQGLCRGK